MVGIGSSGAVNVTSINLSSAAGAGRKGPASTEDILKHIESTLSDVHQNERFKQEELDGVILGKISQHEAAYADKALPRSRLPKVNQVLMDRYQAARRNMLVLGAIQQASRPATNRSNKSASSAPAGGSLADVVSSTTVGADEGEQPTLTACSTFASFDGSGADGAATPGTCQRRRSAINTELSGVSNSCGARLRTEASGRSAVSSYTTASGTTAGGRLAQEASTLSSASGHTLRSDATGYSRFSTHHGRKTPRKRHAKPKPGRVSVAMAEYGGRDDWMSHTLLKHYLASVIQARWRGYFIRKRWAESREQLVEDEKARLAADDLHQERLLELQHLLAAHQQKRLAAAAAAAATAAATAAPPEADAAASVGGGAGQQLPPAVRPDVVSSMGGPARAGSVARSTGGGVAVKLPAVAGSRMQSAHHTLRGAPRFHQTMRRGPAASDVDGGDSDSDSGWSDVELEDLASIKFRAVTPPWQKTAAGSSNMSKQLRHRTAAAAAAAVGKPIPEPSEFGLSGEVVGGLLGVLWDSSSNECSSRLQELRHRRICRRPEPVALSEPAVAAASAAGMMAAPPVAASDAPPAAAPAAGDEGEPSEAAAGTADALSPLPSQAVDGLLLDRYHKKFQRLGVLDKMPGRTRWCKIEEAQAAAAAATAAAAAAHNDSMLSQGTAVAAAADGAGGGDGDAVVQTVSVAVMDPEG